MSRRKSLKKDKPLAPKKLAEYERKLAELSDEIRVVEEDILELQERIHDIHADHTERRENLIRIYHMEMDQRNENAHMHYANGLTANDNQYQQELLAVPNLKKEIKAAQTFRNKKLAEREELHQRIMGHRKAEHLMSLAAPAAAAGAAPARGERTSRMEDLFGMMNMGSSLAPFLLRNEGLAVTAAAPQMITRFDVEETTPNIPNCKNLTMADLTYIARLNDVSIFEPYVHQEALLKKDELCNMLANARLVKKDGYQPGRDAPFTIGSRVPLAFEIPDHLRHIKRTLPDLNLPYSSTYETSLEGLDELGRLLLYV